VGTSYNVNASNFSTIPLYVTGIPGGNNTNAYLYSCEGHIVNSPNQGICLHYNIDTEPGQSGSPVYSVVKNYISNNEEETYVALGINAYSGGNLNFEPRFTKYHLQFYKNNTNIGY